MTAAIVIAMMQVLVPSLARDRVDPFIYEKRPLVAGSLRVSQNAGGRAVIFPPNCNIIRLCAATIDMRVLFQKPTYILSGYRGPPRGTRDIWGLWPFLDCIELFDKLSRGHLSNSEH